ncbi:MAG: hypothetical protein AAFX40_13500 [Cyanobacteria bacterium J06639_1]
MRKILAALNQEKENNQKYVKTLEQQTEQILQQNEALDRERSEAKLRAGTLERLNDRMFRVAQLISEEGSASFSAIFEGVSKTQEMAEKSSQASQSMTMVMYELRNATDVLVGMARTIRVLSMNASAEASRSSRNNSLSVISAEIRKLSEQTSEASGSIKELVDRIQSETDLAVEASQTSLDVVQSLAKKAQKAQASIQTLQALTVQENPAESISLTSASHASNGVAVTA